MDETLNVLEKNGKNIFKPNDNTLDEKSFFEYILDICGREQFIGTVNEMIKLYKNKEREKNLSFVHLTCRLTCVETFM
jgi:hypothetical protein